MFLVSNFLLRTRVLIHVLSGPTTLLLGPSYTSGIVTLGPLS